MGLAILLPAAHAAAADAPYLGISMSPLTPGMSRALKLEEGIGVLVDRVVIGSPAERAGLSSGDIILSIDNRSITGRRELSKILRTYQPGDELKLTIQREGKQRTLKALVGERPKRKVDGRGGFFEGIEFWNWIEGDKDDFAANLKEQMTRLTRGYLGIGLDETRQPKDGSKGALINVVSPGSPAHQAGLLAGDRIVEFNGNAIEDHQSLHQLLDTTEPGDTVELRIERNEELHEMTVELAGIAERLGIKELIQQFQSMDPSDRSGWTPSAPPVPPGPPAMPRSTPRQIEEEQQDLMELRQDLEELKEQLRKLREELSQRR